MSELRIIVKKPQLSIYGINKETIKEIVSVTQLKLVKSTDTDLVWIEIETEKVDIVLFSHMKVEEIE